MFLCQPTQCPDDVSDSFYLRGPGCDSKRRRAVEGWDKADLFVAQALPALPVMKQPAFYVRSGASQLRRTGSVTGEWCLLYYAFLTLESNGQIEFSSAVRMSGHMFRSAALGGHFLLRL